MASNLCKTLTFVVEVLLLFPINLNDLRKLQVIYNYTRDSMLDVITVFRIKVFLKCFRLRRHQIAKSPNV